MRYQRRPARRQLADHARQRSGLRQVRRRLAGAEFREPESFEHALDQAVQPLFQDRYRSTALSRIRALVGRPCQSERRGNPVHRRRVVHRQQSCRRADPDLGRHRDRPAQHPLADRRVLLEGRQRHAAAAGARTGFSIFTRTSTRFAPTGRPSSTPFTRRSAISASSCPAASRKKEHGEFSSNIDLIDTLPPGLYEAIFEPRRTRPPAPT